MKRIVRVTAGLLAALLLGACGAGGQAPPTPHIPAPPTVTVSPDATASPEAAPTASPESTPAATPEAVPAEPDLRTLTLGGWDPQTFDDAEALALAAAGGDSWEAAREAWDALMAAYDRYMDELTFLYVRWDLAPWDEALQEACQAMEDEDPYDRVCVRAEAYLRAPFREAFTAYVGSLVLAGMGSSDDDSSSALYDREAELCREYDALYYERGDITATVGGERWSFDRFADEGAYLDTDSYYAVGAALERAENELLAPVLAELVNVRNELARFYGYDNYYDMLWETDYHRDYTWEDYLVLRENAMTVINALEQDLYRRGYDSDAYFDGDGHDWQLESWFTVCAAAPGLTQSLRNAFGRMDRCGTLTLAGEDAREGCYTTLLSTYRQPLVYQQVLNPRGTMYDLVCLTHESGHALNMSFCGGTSFAWSSYSSYELAETQSQSATLLLSELVDCPVPELAEQYRYMSVYDVVSTISWSSFCTDIERALYTQPEPLTAASANRVADDVADLWGYGEIYGYADSFLAWVESTALADMPCYTVSYVPAAAASLSLWLRWQEEPEAVMERFTALLAADCTRNTFAETALRLELGEVFGDALYEALDGAIRQRLL